MQIFTHKPSILLPVFGLFVLLAGTPQAEVHYYKLKQNRAPLAEGKDFSSAQMMTMWCWAACIQMAYQAQGAQVSQPHIVQVTRGIVGNFPGSIVDVVRALTQVGTDERGDPLSSRAVVFMRSPAGPLICPTPLGQMARWHPAVSTFLLVHGIPTIALYNPGGGTIGHFVLITGVALDGSSKRAVSYQLADPWPLDAAGRRITDDHAVPRRVKAAALENTLQAVVIPLVFTPHNEENMQKLIGWLRNPDRIRNITFDDLDTLADDTGKANKSTDDVGENEKEATGEDHEAAPDAGEKLTDSKRRQIGTTSVEAAFRNGINNLVSASLDGFSHVISSDPPPPINGKIPLCSIKLPGASSSSVLTEGSPSVSYIFMDGAKNDNEARQCFSSVLKKLNTVLDNTWRMSKESDETQAVRREGYSFRRFMGTPRELTIISIDMSYFKFTKEYCVGLTVQRNNIRERLP